MKPTTTTLTTSALPSPSTHVDLEVSPISLFDNSIASDPYSLQAKLIPADSLRQRSARRKVRKFYEEQNANIERLLKSVDDHRLAAATEHEGKQLKVRFERDEGADCRLNLRYEGVL